MLPEFERVLRLFHHNKLAKEAFLPRVMENIEYIHATFIHRASDELQIPILSGKHQVPN
jgi:hypothetical protein